MRLFPEIYTYTPEAYSKIEKGYKSIQNGLACLQRLYSFDLEIIVKSLIDANYGNPQRKEELNIFDQYLKNIHNNQPCKIIDLGFPFGRCIKATRPIKKGEIISIYEGKIKPIKEGMKCQEYNLKLPFSSDSKINDLVITSKPEKAKFCHLLMHLPDADYNNSIPEDAKFNELIKSCSKLIYPSEQLARMKMANCFISVVTIYSMPIPCVYAKKDISVNELIGWDYGPNYWINLDIMPSIIDEKYGLPIQAPVFANSIIKLIHKLPDQFDTNYKVLQDIINKFPNNSIINNEISRSTMINFFTDNYKNVDPIPSSIVKSLQNLDYASALRLSVESEEYYPLTNALVRNRHSCKINLGSTSRNRSVYDIATEKNNQPAKDLLKPAEMQDKMSKTQVKYCTLI